MASLTVRDIPDEVLDRVRILSERDRRSMNKEFLVIVEEGLHAHSAEAERGHAPRISPELQLRLWRDVAGGWEDDRSTGEIVADLRRSRTLGREVHL